MVFATQYRYNELQKIYPINFQTAEYNAKTNQIKVDVVLAEELQSLNGLVIITLYDENRRMLDYSIKPWSEMEEQTFKGIKDYEGTYTVKAFYWDDMTSVEPLCCGNQTELSTK